MRLRIDFQQIDVDLTSLGGVAIPLKPGEMVALGQKLYRALDGPSRRLDGLAPNSTIELLCAADSPALHLAWELLHDGEAFLVQRGIVPVRIVAGGMAAKNEPAANRPLNVLFMACSPRDVRPVLPFEREERIFLDATERQPIYLTPEETGNVDELGETVRDNPAEFDVFHLTGHGDLFDPEHHTKFLHAGQTLRPGKPVLLAENDAGRCELATAEDLERAFGDRLPRLVFLSSCRTSEKPEDDAKGAPRPLVQELLTRGFPAVLGWARPVYDRSATLAAALLYKEIAAGSAVEQALRHTLRELTKPSAQDGQPFQIPDWHLLRLFSQPGSSAAALVTPLNARGRAPFVPPRREDGFLDKEGKVKVAGLGFVGRRRSLQRTLPAFEVNSGYAGVVVWGMGGLGKSSLAARLCDRVERKRVVFRRAVLQGALDEPKLLAVLTAKYDDHDALPELSAAGRPLSGRLKRFFTAINADAPLLLVLDDFEQNIELNAGAPEGFLLKRAGFETLSALGQALHEARTQSRLIVTSRQWNEGAFPKGVGLLAEQLPQMDREDLRKKARNTEELERAAGEDLVARALGNPKLFEKLAQAQAKGDIAQATELFQRWLQVPELLAGLTAAERHELARLSVFQLPVPESVAREVGGGDFARAIGLGLAERTEAVTEDGEPLLEAPAILRPLLKDEMEEEERRAACGVAARALQRVWWECEDEAEEAQVVETVRLATKGGEQAIACDLMECLANTWREQYRYGDIICWGQQVLGMIENYRLRLHVASAERQLGLTAAAETDIVRAIQGLPGDDERALAWSLEEWAALRRQQADLDGARALLEKASAIRERVGDEPGRAAALHNLAALREQQGYRQEALAIYGKVREIDLKAGNAKGIAVTIANMAGILAQDGHLEDPMPRYEESLELLKQSGNQREQAGILREIAGVRLRQRDWAGAQTYYERARDLQDLIGDEKGKAVTLVYMSTLLGRKDVESAARYAKEAAGIFKEIRAWPDLLAALGNLSLFDAEERRLFWLAQAVWLPVALRLSTSESLSIVSELFHAVPTAHPLELRLAALAGLIFAQHGPEELRAKNLEQATELFGIAAGNQGMMPEAARAWFQEQASNPGRLLQETLRALEELAPEPWIYDRNAVLASIQEASAQAAAAGGGENGKD